MTDFRALCAELVDDLELCDWPYKLKETIRADIDRARAALADEPAVLDGREPASVTGQPSDEELLATLDKATAAFPPRHPEAEGLNASEYLLALELRKARAVLGRWGNPAPPPADGEVAELVAWLRERATWCTAEDPAHKKYDRAAELLQRQALVPPADGEVAELVAWLRSTGEGQPCLSDEGYARLTRAADLLQRQVLPEVNQMAWQPIDTAPRDGTEILASDYDAIEIVSWVGPRFDVGITGEWTNREGEAMYPAWWQPLPDHLPLPGQEVGE